MWHNHDVRSIFWICCPIFLSLVTHPTWFDPSWNRTPSKKVYCDGFVSVSSAWTLIAMVCKSAVVVKHNDQFEFQLPASCHWYWWCNVSISRSLDIGIGYRQQWLLKHVSSVSIFKRFGMFVLLMVPWISSPNLWEFRGQKTWRNRRENWRSTSSTRSCFFKRWFDIFDSWCRIVMFIVCPQKTNFTSRTLESKNQHIVVYVYTLLHCYIFS